MSFHLLRNDDCDWSFEFVAYIPDNFRDFESMPVIAFLHGSMERGCDPGLPLKGAAEVFEHLQLPAAIIFPQCDTEHRGYYGAMQLRVLRAIDRIIRDFGADARRVYLVGYSMGGSSNLWLASQYPDKFAGIVCIAPGITWLGAEYPSRLPAEVEEVFKSMFVAENRTETIARFVNNVPIWFLQGTADQPCPIDETRSLVYELRKLGSNPKFTEYDGMDHDSLGVALREEGLFHWLLTHSIDTPLTKFSFF